MLDAVLARRLFPGPPSPPPRSSEDEASDSNESTATVSWPERLVLPSLHMRQRQDPLVVTRAALRGDEDALKKPSRTTSTA